jgi:serine/threonine-protein kinase
VTAPVERLNQALLGRYQIQHELGQGGMATVYLADDLRHHRKVALKVLRPELSAVIGAERFLHEITTTANLQHPHILGLHDSGQVDGTVFYVMPYVDGESLRDRLNREKQLPVDQAVRIAREVAAALDYAHRQGVIHRDIKPENILLHDGAALVADFGIALAASRTGGTRMTETGMSLGTPHYMSPEQAMGERTLDARTDVYALGCVLYEMLAGEPPFTGPTPQAIVARVVTESPRSLSLLRHTVPPELDAAVAKALEKLPADRYATAAELAAALETGPVGWRSATTATRVLPAVAPRRIVAFLSAGILILAGLAAWGWLRPQPKPQVARFLVELEDFNPDGDDSPAISPDGRMLVYGAYDGSLSFRNPAAFGVNRLAGSGDSWSPFFAPDGRRFGYLTGFPGDLRIVTVATGASITLVKDSVLAYGGSWSDDGWVYYTTSEGRSLMRIRTDGTSAELVLRADSTRDEFAFKWPHALPGGTLLVTVWRRRGPADIAVVEPGQPPRVVTQGLRAFPLPSGHLVVIKGSGTVTAARFSLGDMSVQGQAVELITDVRINSGGTPAFAISPNGTVLYNPHKRTARLVRVDRTGRAEVVDPAWVGDLGWPALSPDGTRMALATIVDGRREVWLKTLPDGPYVRVAAAGSQSYRPFWSPDGRWVGFTSDLNGLSAVYRIAADGSGGIEPIYPLPRSVDEGHWSSDGSWFVFRAGSGRGRDILGVRLGGDSTPVPLVVTEDEEFSPVVSPDGRWLAYGSLASGQEEVFVRPLTAGPAGRVQASTAGGTEPVWSLDGRELFYRSRDGNLVALTPAPGPEFRVQNRRVLFPVRQYQTDVRHHAYAVGRDGSFYFFQQAAERGQRMVLIQNWLEDLKERVP